MVPAVYMMTAKRRCPRHRSELDRQVTEGHVHGHVWRAFAYGPANCILNRSPDKVQVAVVQEGSDGHTKHKQTNTRAPCSQPNCRRPASEEGKEVTAEMSTAGSRTRVSTAAAAVEAPQEILFAVVVERREEEEETTPLADRASGVAASITSNGRVGTTVRSDLGETAEMIAGGPGRPWAAVAVEEGG